MQRSSRITDFVDLLFYHKVMCYSISSNEEWNEGESEYGNKSECKKYTNTAVHWKHALSVLMLWKWTKQFQTFVSLYHIGQIIQQHYTWNFLVRTWLYVALEFNCFDSKKMMSSYKKMLLSICNGNSSTHI